MATASNIAYQYLRSTASSATYVKATCSTTTQPGSQSLNANTGLNNASVNVVISCPYSSAPLNKTSLLTATVTYTSPNGQQTVAQAMYAKAATEESSGGGTSGGGSGTVANGDPIQTITSANCPSTRTRAVDARDNRTYWVQKLADGKCWMLTNLAYGGGGTNTYGDVRTLTSNSSDQSSTVAYYIIPTGANVTTEPTNPSTSTTGTGQYGYLYNFCAANGGQTGNGACSSSSSVAVSTTQSICPKGWRLPMGGDNNGTEETSDLNVVINNGSSSTDAGWLNTWLAQRGGYWAGTFSSQGSGGWYWLSTQFDNQSAFTLNLTSSKVYPSVANYKEKRFSVRCVAT